MYTFRTYDLAVNFYGLCERIKLKGSLRDQLIRASSSIALNLREGAAQPTVREVQAIIDLKKLDQLKGPADKLGAHLYKLCHQKLELKNS